MNPFLFSLYLPNQVDIIVKKNSDKLT